MGREAAAGMEHWKRRFIILGVGQAVSILTSSIMQYAIVWYLTQRTGSAAVITMATLSGYLPRGVLGLFSGAIIDRYDRKRIIMLSDLVIALAALSLAGVAMWTEIPIGMIFLILCIRSVGAAFHTPSLNAVIPSIVPRDQLARCAGFLQSFESVSLILSPAIAAVLFNLWDLSAMILLDVAGAAIAILIVLFTAIPKRVAAQGAGNALHLWRDTKEGLRVLRRYEGMTTLMVVSTLYAFIYFPIGTLYPVITMTYFGGTVADSSMVEIVFSVGTLLGALFLGMLGGRIHKIRAITASIGIYGVGVLFSGLLPPDGLRVFTFLSLMMGLTLPFFYGLRTAIFQSTIPDDYLGRVLSLANSVTLFAAPLGLLMGGAVSELAGVQNCFAICGALSILLAVAMLATPSVRGDGLEP